MTQLTPPPQYGDYQPTATPIEQPPPPPPPPMAPPPQPYQGGPAAQFGPPPPQPYQYYQYPTAQARPSGNALGTAGLVTGIIGLVLFWVPFLDVILGVLATTFGGIGYNKVRNGSATNGGSALAGIVMGAVTLVVGIAFTIWAMATA